MKTQIHFFVKALLLALIALFVTGHTLTAQTAAGSLKVNFINFKLSSDTKTISYDVYVQDVDPAHVCGLAGYCVRAKVPISNLGSNSKTVSVTNANVAMGAYSATMSIPGSDPASWLMKFQNSVAIMTWAATEKILETYPGTLLATFNITNTDGTSFSDPVFFPAFYSGSTLTVKTTLSLFLENTNTLASDATTALPYSRFTGIGADVSNPVTYTLTATAAPVISYTTPQVYTHGTDIGTLSPTTTGGAVASYSVSPALPAGLTLSSTTGEISGTPTAATASATYTITATNAGGTGTFDLSITVLEQLDWVNLQWPGSGTIALGGNFDVYAQTYEPGVTPGGGQGAGIQSWIGYSTTDTDPSTWTNWLAASYNGAVTGNNDEYTANLGTAISTAGTYYYASRFQLGSASYVYGGYSGGIWGGGNVNGVLTVNIAAPVISYTTPQVYTHGTDIGTLSPTTTGGAVASYSVSPALPAGLTLSSTTGEISGTPTAATASATYTITATNAGGTGTFDLSITVLEQLDWVNLQWPGSGTIALGGNFDVYAQAYEPGVTPGGGQGAGIQSWIGYSTTDTDPSTWTNWLAASYNGAVTGNNDEYTANLGTAISTAGTYYYASRFQLGSASYVYGGYSGGIWGGGNVNGVLTVNIAAPVISYTTPQVYTYGTDIGTLSPTTTGGAVASYSVSPALPAGLSLNTTTGEITGTPTAATASATYTITGTNAGGTGTSDLSITVNPKALTITGVSASNKPYDGTTVATLTGGSLVDIVGTDDVTLVAGSGTFASAGVGTGIVVTASGYTLVGTKAGNYTLSQPTGLSADITSTSQTITFNALPVVTYGDADFALTGSASSGLSVSYASSNSAVATVSGVTVTIVGAGTATITASQAGDSNYTAAADVAQVLTVNPKALTITGVSASNKPYDGTTVATLTGGSLVDVVGTDDVTLVAGSGTFASAGVGTGIVVTASGYTLVGTKAGNYTLSQPTGLSADITSTSQTITFNALPVVTYGDADFALTGSASSGLSVSYASSNSAVATVSGVTVTIVGAGTATITASQAGDSNYTAAADVAQVLTVNPKALTITGVSASNKPYDGTTVATLTGGSLVDVVGTDDVTLVAGSGTFASAGVGTGIVVTASGYTLVGTQAGNYTLSSQPGGLSANITTKALTITGVTASNKIYDGTTVATLTGGSLVGVVGTDDVTLVAGSGTFASSGVGTGIVVTASGYTLGGTQAGNYTLSSQPGGLSANITTKALTITGVTALNKPYDGTTVATLTGGSLVDVVGTDDVTLVAGSGTFASAGVGTGIVVTASGYTLVGTKAGNYTLSQPTGLSADITSTSQTITFNALPVVTYGDADFALTGSASSGLSVSYASSNSAVATVSGVTVTIVGAGTATITASQAGDSNYTAAADVAQVLTVNPKALTITGVSASNKPYDGTTVATLTGGSLVDVVGTDDVTLVAGSGTFASAGVGTGIVVTASGYTLVGTKAGNYTLSQPTGLSADITSTSQTITFNALPVVTYGDADFALTGSASSGLSVSYASSNSAVATVSGVTVTIVGAGTATITASQAGDSNYTAAADVAQVLTVNPKALTITGVSASNKPYDGTTVATLTGGSLVDVVGTDDVTLVAGSGTFASAGVGTGIVVTASGYTLVGTKAGNYTLSQPTGLSADITSTSQTITFNALPVVTYGDADFALTGSASSGLSVSYASSNSAVATVSGATVTIVGAGTATITASQAGDSNYTAAADVAQVLTVNPKALTITGVSASNKPYDGTTVATLTGGSLVDIVGTDDVTLVAGSGTFASAGVGTGIVVTASGYTLVGTKAGNYTLSQPTGLSADITSTSQTITFNALPVVTYGDADFALTGSASSGLSVSYASSNSAVATVSGVTVTIVGAGTATITASQAGDSNYTAAADVAQVLTVNPKALTITGVSASNKPYDGTTVATLTGGSLVGVVGTDDVTLVAGSGTFASSGVGTGIVVTASGYTLGGTKAGNYTLSSQPGGLSANITKSSQTISFAALGTKTIGDAPFTVFATGGGSGNPVTFSSSDNNIATCTGTNGATITIISTGSCTIYANQTGNSNYNAATQVGQLLTITNGVDVPSNLRYLNPVVFTVEEPIVEMSPTVIGTVTSYTVSSLPTGLSINATTGEISGTPSAVSAAANYTVTASNANGSTTFGINITIQGSTASSTDAPANLRYLSPLVFTAGQDITPISPTVNGTVTSYTVSSLPAGLIINATTGEISGTPTAVSAAANYTVTASNTNGSTTFDLHITIQSSTPSPTDAPANLRYLSPVVFTVGKAIDDMSPSVRGTVTTYTASSLPSGLRIDAATGIISGTPTGITSARNYIVAASNAFGSTCFAVNITVRSWHSKQTQTITFAALGTKTMGDAPFTLSATASSGLAVSFVSSNTSVATISGNMVTIVGTGTTTIVASQAGR